MVDGPPLLSRKVGPKNQINLPAEYLGPMGIQQGQQVYIGPNPDKPGTLVIVPEQTMALIFEKGWTAVE